MRGFVSHHIGSQLRIREIKQFRWNYKLGVINWRNSSYNRDLIDFQIDRNRKSTTIVWTLGICNHAITMSKA